MAGTGNQFRDLSRSDDEGIRKSGTESRETQFGTPTYSFKLPEG
jgi:hypothetical protein